MSKSFGADRIRLNLVDLIQQASDPSLGAGVAAAIGSYYLRSGTAGAYLKTGAAATAWQKIVQSYEWYSVLDYGASGNGIATDTTYIQNAIDACANAGGGVTYVPFGRYLTGPLDFDGRDNVQLIGCGAASELVFTHNAGGAASSLISITDTQNIRLEDLKLTGSGLTNPLAGQNHLVALGNGGGAPVTDVRIVNVEFGGMVANGGDGVHILGTLANPIQRYWIEESVFDGCTRYGVGVEQGANYGWICSNFFSNNATDIAVVPSGAVANKGLLILDNQIVHTGAVRHAIRIEGNAGALMERITLGANDVIAGFVTISGVKYCVVDANIGTSGVYASTDAMWRVFGDQRYTTMTNNTLVRDPAASVGPCMSLERSGGASPQFTRIGNGTTLINERVGANFITVVDSSRFSIGGVTMRASDATGTVYGIDIQGVTTTVEDFVVGGGNVMSTAAGSIDAFVRTLANGASVQDFIIGGNNADGIDYGWRAEDAGAGSITGFMYAGNTFDAALGDIDQVGVTVRPNIGFNKTAAGTVGAQSFSGTGSPEGTISARIGSLYLQTDGGQNQVFWYKETGTGTTGWVAVGGAPIIFGAGDAGTVATALFLGAGYIGSASATEIAIPMTRAGTIRNLRINVVTAGVDAQNVVYTVRKNGVDTTLTVTAANAAAGQSTDLVNSFTVAIGDLLSIGLTKSGAVATGQGPLIAAVELA
jgi:hypothetical protein